MLVKLNNAFSGGHIVIGAPWGIPIRLHWSAVLGALWFTRFSFMPAAWAAFFAVIVIHELGHAAVVRGVGKSVTRIEVNALGGLCEWRGETTHRQRVAIAWGGVLAQAVLLAVALVVVQVFGHATTNAWAQVEDVAIRVNMIIAGLNLLPIPPLDGATAWQLVFGPPKEPTPIEPRLTGQRPLVMREPRAVVMTEDGDRVDDSDSSDDRHRSDRD
jgi:Zn-dependent protease